MSHKFVIVDGSSLVHRAFYALPPLTTASGQYTNAVYGFATMLVKLLDEVKPEAVAVAFDKGRVTFRTEAYAQYKAHRKATPAELSEQFPLIHELLRAFGITVIEEAGFEADDIIGTLATKAVEADYEVIIVTGDRDALQLLQPSVKVMMTKKGISEMELFDAEVFRNKYGIEADQLVDLKGLMGDSSDNIPGVPGVGEKTALKLIREFGTVENLIENLDKVSGKKLQENLRNNTDVAVISKKLATIVRDMSIEFNFEEYIFQPNRESVQALFAKFEFRSLLARIDLLFPGTSVEQSKPDESLPAIRVVSSCSEIEELANTIRQTAVFMFCPVLAGHIPEIQFHGLAVVTSQNEPVYIPANAEGWQSIVSLFAESEVQKITHDVKNVYTACSALGLELTGPIADTMLAAYLLDTTAADYSITVLKEKYLSYSAAQGKLTLDPAYAGWAVQGVKELYPILAAKLAAVNLTQLYYEIELPLVEVLAAMERCGIRVDGEHVAVMAADIAVRVDLLLGEIYQLAGEEFNVNSPKQLGNILFDKLSLPVIKKTKTGYSTDAEVLEKLSGQHPLIDKLLEYRLLTKLKSTYLDGLQALIHKKTGRIHTTFNQMITATGRLSSSNPNLQNIPIRTEMGRRIREVFVPDEDYQYIMSADYSQIELRVLAHMSGDYNLIEAFTHNQDVHTRTASEVFGVNMSEVTAEMRSRAKAVNFGIVYGISDYGLSRDLGVSRKEAAQYIENYFAKCFGVKNFIDQVVAEAHHQGYVTTLFGRRRQLPDINSGNYNQRSFAERTAMNTPIQGTAADIIKKAMIDVYGELKRYGLRSRLLLQVHDELVLEVTEDEVDQVAEIVKRAMEQAVKLDVPLLADVKWGRNWAGAK